MVPCHTLGVGALGATLNDRLALCLQWLCRTAASPLSARRVQCRVSEFKEDAPTAKVLKVRTAYRPDDEDSPADFCEGIGMS